MAANEENGVGIDQQVYLAADIQRMLGIGKSKSYMFLEEVYKQKIRHSKFLKLVNFSECQRKDLMTG